jgi:hypothetical protein
LNAILIFLFTIIHSNLLLSDLSYTTATISPFSAIAVANIIMTTSRSNEQESFSTASSTQGQTLSESTYHIEHKIDDNHNHNSNSSSSSSINNNNNNKNLSSSVLWDCPDFDLRLIRKTEGVIQKPIGRVWLARVQQFCD